MKPFIDLTGKTILVTGASSGIGRAVAILISELGAKGILIARREDQLRESVDRMAGVAAWYSADLQDVDGIDGLMSRIITEHGPLDGFVHSAGISTTVALRALTMNMMEKSMRLNFYSFLEIARCITRKNCFNPPMSIVAISSLGAVQGRAGGTIYCASKAALDASVRCLARELAPKMIRVNSVAPALIKTAMYNDLRDRLKQSEQVQNVVDRQYMGVGEPEDVANIVCYLLSSAAKYVTGASIPLDGGRLTT